jgi:hypothetical protein
MWWQYMESTGKKLIHELKILVLQTMRGIPECAPGGHGVRYRVKQDLADLSLELPAHDGWLTWSLLAALVEDGQVEVRRYGRRLYWILSRS